MWDVEKYNMTLKRIVQKGIFLEMNIKTKEAVYEILSSRLFVTIDTVKGWGRKNSHGPGDEEVRKKLEELLETSFYKRKKPLNDSEEISVDIYSDFVKRNIFKAYEIIMNHIKSSKVQDEDAYLEVCNQINNLKIGIPSNIYRKIIDFMEEYLDVLICDEDTFFESLYKKKALDACDDSERYVSDFSQYEWLRKDVSLLDYIVEDFEEFGMKVLYPVLMN